jgi:DNA-binding NarL/FixJ family response regulator
MRLHLMRGTVLLLNGPEAVPVDVDLLRVNGLIVYDCDELAGAVDHLRHVSPDVIVVVLPASATASIVAALRSLADRATSIIATSVPAQRDAALHAGADSFLLNSAEPSDLLYEIHRALILRRSGRRLPRNW